MKYLETIEGINPGKIYVEHVRSILHTNTFWAKVACEMAVRDNLFEKKIGVICPNSDCNRVIKSFDTKEDIPEKIECTICHDNGKEEYSFLSSKCKKETFYLLKSSK